jgi:hypothetical protein
VASAAPRTWQAKFLLAQPENKRRRSVADALITATASFPPPALATLSCSDPEKKRHTVFLRQDPCAGGCRHKAFTFVRLVSCILSHLAHQSMPSKVVMVHTSDSHNNNLNPREECFPPDRRLEGGTHSSVAPAQSPNSGCATTFCDNTLGTRYTHRGRFSFVPYCVS